jgi:hypothetical protein
LEIFNIIASPYCCKIAYFDKLCAITTVAYFVLANSFLYIIFLLSLLLLLFLLWVFKFYFQKQHFTANSMSQCAGQISGAVYLC